MKAKIAVSILNTHIIRKWHLALFSFLSYCNCSFGYFSSVFHFFMLLTVRVTVRDNVCSSRSMHIMLALYAHLILKKAFEWNNHSNNCSCVTVVLSRISVVSLKGACDDNAKCASSKCDRSACICGSGSLNAKLKICTDKVLVGETCTTTENCNLIGMGKYKY